MKELKLFVDFEFTSLSPDAQPISLGIISEGYYSTVLRYSKEGMDDARKYLLNFGVFIPGMEIEQMKGYLSLTADLNIYDWDRYQKYIQETEYKGDYPIIEFINKILHKGAIKNTEIKLIRGEYIIDSPGLAFYAEFSDFDINRCDDWVKENVVGKLKMFDGATCIGMDKSDALKILNRGIACISGDNSDLNVVGDQHHIKIKLKEWLAQFSDYQITFVVDCGCYDWYHLLQLIGEWEEKEREVRDGDEIYDITSEKGILISSMGDYELIVTTKTGLPKLPSNISPVPFELNQFIAEKKGISVREAFEFNREELLIEDVVGMVISEKSTLYGEPMQKHNALWDAKVMKAIYEKLSV